jgi:hypothetical protein
MENLLHQKSPKAHLAVGYVVLVVLVVGKGVLM